MFVGDIWYRNSTVLLRLKVLKARSFICFVPFLRILLFLGRVLIRILHKNMDGARLKFIIWNRQFDIEFSSSFVQSYI